ncbi:MAG: Mfa1 family fimbria major subunit [Bacteroides sp.]|nr:Mfa1 family fimbria major subunit [Bacteroides sp.]
MERRIIHILFAFLCFILVAGSCVVESSHSQTNQGNNEEVYISMDFSTPLTSVKTKAPTDEEIDTWEHRVNEVWMLLYNDEEKLDYKFVWKVQNYNDSDPSVLINFQDKGSEQVIVSGSADKLTFISAAQKIKRKNYKMAILANPPQEYFSQINEGTTLSALTKAIDGGQQGLSINTFGSYKGDPSTTRLFFMSNANGLITINSNQLQASKPDAESNPTKVNLDRLLAKVVVKEKTGGVTISTSGAILDEQKPVKWYLDVINTKTYPIRQFAFLSGGTEMENEQNSTAAIRERIYAQDPNFVLTDNTATSFKKLAPGETPTYANWITNKTQDPDLRTFQYVFENTMNLATQSNDNWKNYTTQIVIKAHLVYTELLNDPTNTNNDNDPGKNYYSCVLTRSNNTIVQRVFTHAQANHWLTTVFPTSTDSGEEEILRLMETKIKEVQTDFESGVSDAFNLKAASAPGTSEATFRSYKGITYHPLGLNKYVVPVRHFSNTSGSTDPRKDVYGYYGVVRNNMYTLTVNSISGPGTGLYDWDSHFMSVQINITPWYRRDFQEEDLK